MLSEKIKNLNLKHSRLLGQKQEIVTQLKDFETKIDNLNLKIKNLKLVSQVFGKIVERVINVSKENIESLLTHGLKAVFFSQNNSVKVDFDIKRNVPSINILTQQIKKGNKIITGDVDDSFGGGLSNIQSVLLRILVIQNLGLKKFIVLDESLNNVSPEFRESAAKFLNKICDDFGFDILMVTQNRPFALHSKVNYWASADDSDNLCLENKNLDEKDL